nr:MAG TPA: hypothetical protein [Caudoviricetes sp.]
MATRLSRKQRENRKIKHKELLLKIRTGAKSCLFLLTFFTSYDIIY